MYPFGYGLSYSTFAYSGLKFSSNDLQAGDPFALEVDVKNTSRKAGDEVIQIYLTFPKLPGAPLRALWGFAHIHLDAGESRHVQLALQPRDLSYVNDAGDRLITAGDYVVTVGGGQPGTTASKVELRISIRGQQQLPE